MVRVAHTENQLRALIKEMNGQIQDLAFAHIFNQVILGCVDEEGSLFVHKVEQQEAIMYPFFNIFVKKDLKFYIILNIK